MSKATDAEVNVSRGLKGVYFDRSGISSIDGRAGELRYCGYSIHELAKHSTFEETAYLLVKGELPDANVLRTFNARLKALRSLPDAVVKIVRGVRPSSLPSRGSSRTTPSRRRHRVESGRAIPAGLKSCKRSKSRCHAIHA